MTQKCSHVIEFKLPVSDSHKLNFRMGLVYFLETLITFRVCFPALSVPLSLHFSRICSTWYIAAVRSAVRGSRTIAAAYCASLTIRSHYMSTCGNTRVPREYADWKWTAITLKLGQCGMLCVSQKRSCYFQHWLL